jgi:ABC-type glycerol-3-phosphate transport system permease component
MTSAEAVNAATVSLLAQIIAMFCGLALGYALARHWSIKKDRRLILMVVCAFTLRVVVGMLTRLLSN